MRNTSRHPLNILTHPGTLWHILTPHDRPPPTPFFRPFLSPNPLPLQSTWTRAHGIRHSDEYIYIAMCYTAGEWERIGPPCDMRYAKCVTVIN